MDLRLRAIDAPGRSHFPPPPDEIVLRFDQLLLHRRRLRGTGHLRHFLAFLRLKHANLSVVTETYYLARFAKGIFAKVESFEL